MQDSFVQLNAAGAAQSFVGTDAVKLYGIIALKSAINLHGRCGMIPTRGMTITRLLANATALTGKPYKGAGKHDRAVADLQATIDATKAAMPILDHAGKPV